MIKHFIRTCNPLLNFKSRANFAQDWSHVYDGIFRFQDKTLGEDVLAIRQQALNFAKTKLSPFAIQWEKNHVWPVQMFKQAAQAGFSAIYCKSGLGLSRLQASIIFEALATGDVPSSAYLSIHNMCCWIIDQFGTKQQKQQHLPKLISMQNFSSYCLTQPDSGSDAQAMKSTAKKQGDQYVLNGSKMFISGGSYSGTYIVMAKTGEKAISTFIVPGDAKGLSYGKKQQKMGWTIQPTALVTFDNVRIPSRFRVGEEGVGFKIALKGLDGGRVNIASCSLGGAAFCMQAAKNYMNNRKQFGQKLSDFQYLQFKYADMAADLVTSRLIVRKAAELLDKKDSNGTLYAAMAKKVATQLCSGVCDYALQMHGGYGYLKQYGIQKYVRDLRVHQILQGTNQIMRLIISRKLLKQ